MSKSYLFVVLLILMTACQPTGGEPGMEEPAGTAIPEGPSAETPAGDAFAPITAAATSYLAAELGEAEEDIQVVSA
jgi:hypothetical protein